MPLETIEESLPGGMAVEYAWVPESGETLTILRNEAGETLTVSLQNFDALQQAVSRTRNRARLLRSEQRALVNHPRDLGLVPGEGRRWTAPDIDLESFGAPYLLWNGQHDRWETRLAWLDCGARMSADWDDREGIANMVSYLDADVLLAEAALADPDTVRHSKTEYSRRLLLNEASSALAGVKVNMALIRRTLLSAGLGATGYRSGRVIVAPLHLPGSTQAKAPLAVVGLPRWHRREDPAAMFVRVKDALEAIGYQHVSTVPCEGYPRSDIYVPGPADLATPYAEPLAFLAGQVVAARGWGTPV